MLGFHAQMGKSLAYCSCYNPLSQAHTSLSLPPVLKTLLIRCIRIKPLPNKYRNNWKFNPPYTVILILHYYMFCFNVLFYNCTVLYLSIRLLLVASVIMVIVFSLLKDINIERFTCLATTDWSSKNLHCSMTRPCNKLRVNRALL